MCNFLFFFSFLLCKGAGKSVDPITVAIFVQVPQKTVLPSTGGPCVHQSQADMRREGEASTKDGRMGLTHAEAQESGCHSQHSTLP